MLRKIKYGKVAVVIFITVLIWVWTDLELDEELSDRPATIVVDESASPKLWVRLNQASSADIRITLSGPHSAIVDVSRQLKEIKRLKIDFDAVQENMDKPGDHILTLLPFLQKGKEMKRLGLKVKSCEPETLDVQVVKLVEKTLTVECFDEDGIPLEVESIPSKVKMFALEETRTARVQLSRREIEQARLLPIEKTPYVVLAAGQTRQASSPVKIKIQAEDVLKDYTIKTPVLGFCLSANLQDKYKVEVDNLNEVRSPIAIRATPEAKLAYESMRYHVILEIDDEDAKPKEGKREVAYNFPEEYVRKKEIELKNPQPVIAQFRLIPLSPAGAQ